MLTMSIQTRTQQKQTNRCKEHNMSIVVVGDQTHTQPSNETNETCKCCRTAEPAGYIGNGIYLKDLCRKCYKAHGEQLPGRGYKHHNKGGTSG